MTSYPGKLQTLKSATNVLTDRQKIKKTAEEEYKKLLIDSVKNGLEELIGSPLTEPESIRLYDIENMIADPDCKINGIPMHVLHYGYQPKECRHWKNRLPFDGVGPFEEVQRDLFEHKGLYLLDISDPKKSFEIRIGLYLNRPSELMEHALWHGYNVIPDEVTIIIDSLMQTMPTVKKEQFTSESWKKLNDMEESWKSLSDHIDTIFDELINPKNKDKSEEKHKENITDFVGDFHGIVNGMMKKYTDFTDNKTSNEQSKSAPIPNIIDMMKTHTSNVFGENNKSQKDEKYFDKFLDTFIDTMEKYTPDAPENKKANDHMAAQNEPLMETVSADSIICQSAGLENLP